MITDVPIPSLFIGGTQHPYSLRRHKEETWDEYNDRLETVSLVDLRVHFTSLQTGGVACHHLNLFGCFFEITGELMHLCADTCLMAPATLEVIKDYDEELKKHGLFLSGDGYVHLEEGAIAGINPDALFAYIKERKCKLWARRSITSEGQTYIKDEWIVNNFTSLDEMMEVIAKVYNEASRETDNRAFSYGLPLWTLTGIITYQNCD